MSRKSKASRERGLQIGTAKDAEMKVPNLTRSKSGSYCFRMTVPADVRASLPRDTPDQQGKANIWETLGHDRKCAALRAEELNAMWHRRIDEERRKLRGESSLSAQSPSIFSLACNPPSYRSLSLLSAEEVKQLIIRDFINHELALVEERQKFALFTEDEYRGGIKEKMIEAFSKLTILEPRFSNADPNETDHFVQISKDEFLRRPHYGLDPFFKARGIIIDAASEPSLMSYASFYIKSLEERRKRTLAALQGNYGKSFDPDFPTTKELSNPKTVGKLLGGKEIITINSLCKKFLQSKEEGRRSASTLKNIRTATRIAREFFGGNTPISDLTYEDGKNFVRFLKTIPKNSGKRYPNTTVVRAAKQEARKQTPIVISKKTAEMHYDYASEMFKSVQQLFESGVNHVSPLLEKYKELIPDDPVRVDFSNKMYTGKEITRLFTSKEFLNSSGGPWKKGSNASSRYWIPFLCLFHGMRLSEAAQLYVSNIKQESRITYMEVTDYGDENKGVVSKSKRVKTRSSVRNVALHPEMVKLGFLDFVEKRRNESKGQKNVALFKEIDINPNSELPVSNAVSKWFARIRTKIFGKPDFPGDRGLHSFRHGFRAAADKRVGETLQPLVARDLVDAICGWTGKGGVNNSNSGDLYGTGKTGHPIKDLHQAICKIEFPGANLSSLYPGDKD